MDTYFSFHLISFYLFYLLILPILAQYQQPQPHHTQGVAPGQQASYGVPQYSQDPSGQPNILHDRARIHDTEHIREHEPSLQEPDISKMTEEELQFHYFKLHDSDNNNMLDGLELIKSLIHWHVEESKHLGANAPPTGTTKLFTDIELQQMIDPILATDDKNHDGYIDYPEFVIAQRSRRL